MSRSNFGAVRLPLLAAAVLASFAVDATAQVVEKGRTFADLTASHPCNTGLTERIARVTDCDAADDIGDGEGAFQCWARCDGSAPWEAVAIGGGVDLSPYVLLAGDADGQTIQGVTGVDKARVELGLGGLGLARVFGGNPNTFIQVGDGTINIEGSTDGTDANSAWLSVTSHGLEFDAADGEAQFSVDSVTGFDFTGTMMRFNVPVPATAADTCFAGMFAWDASHIYVCIALDTWKRTALSTW